MTTKEKWAKRPSRMIRPEGPVEKLTNYNEKTLAGK
jgi:hypothetical protein